MRVVWLSIWLGLVYVSASLACGEVLHHAVTTKTLGDERYAASHMEWAMGILLALLFVWTKPLFYSWRVLGKNKIIAFTASSIGWPLYLVLVGALLVLMPINWPQLLKVWQYPGIWLWIGVSFDPLNVLGKWIDESDFWQSHIDTWRSYGTLSWLYSAYPPRTAGDVAVGLVCALAATMIAPLVYLVRT